MYIFLCSMNDRMHKVAKCHPERLEKIEDFRKESKDLRTDLIANVIQMRRFFDFADAPLRMTDLCVFDLLR